MLEDCFVGKGIGAKAGTFTPEDIELFKYTFAEYCKCKRGFLWSLTNPEEILK